MKNISIGKLRGLQQIAGPDGILTICAMDHRGSMERMLGREIPQTAMYDEMVKRKLELCSIMAEHSTAVLLDPIYGAAQCISAGVLPENCGLLVSIESSGYSGGDEYRLTELLEHWSVEKIKRMGASAVKILIYFRSDLEELASQQLATAQRVAEQCIDFDIPFLVEPVAYPVGKEKNNPEHYARLKEGIVIETARKITDLPIDVLKSEFPADIRYNQDKGALTELCRRVDAAAQTPWVILSAGVDFDLFYRQVEIACRAGASGFLGGRAIWQEAMEIGDDSERIKFLKTVGVDRLNRLTDIAAKYAVPWYKKLGLTGNELAVVHNGWYADY